MNLNLNGINKYEIMSLQLSNFFHHNLSCLIWSFGSVYSEYTRFSTIIFLFSVVFTNLAINRIFSDKKGGGGGRKVKSTQLVLQDEPAREGAGASGGGPL